MALVKHPFVDGKTKIGADVLNDIQDAVIDLENNTQAMNLDLLAKVDGGYVEDGYLYLTSKGDIVVGPLGPFSTSGGGGGSGENNAVLTVNNVTGWISTTVAHGSSCVVIIEWSSLESGIETGDGTLKVTVNGQVKSTTNVKQGRISVDLKDYLNVGNNTVKITVTDIYGNARTIFFSAAATAVSIASTFDASAPFTGSINFTYTPVGNIEKNVHFVLDGTEIGTAIVTASGRQQSFTIPKQSHGSHALKVWFDCTISETTVTSNVLYYEIICIEDGNTTPIIASSFNGTTGISQYSNVVIPYRVYSPANLTAQITLEANGEQVSSLTVDRTEHTWSYRAMDTGELTLKIRCGDVVVGWVFNVSESNINIEAETEALALFLSSYGRSNSEKTPGVWTYNDIAAEFSGFNFVSDGWQSDEDNVSVLRVSGDARVTIPHQIFANDFRTTGKTIEIEFATRDILDYDAVIMSCFSDNRGIKLTAQKAVLKSEQSEISTQYKEDEHVRLSFVVEKRAENRLVYCYINGVMSGVLQYPADDDFSQTNPVGISIGSNDCTMDIYCIRVYDNNLTRFQVLDNWIADTQNADEMIARYERNAVFDAYGQIVISNLPKDLPYLILEAEELPQYKGDKKSVNGAYVDVENSGQSFTFSEAQADVQGTSSQYYARKNYKIKFKGGFVNGNGETSEDYQMRTNAVPTNTFTFKADVASSEGANNVELVRLYNDICPYKTPPQQEDERIRQGIDGFPIVVFWYDGSNTTFVGKYNFNNDKGTPEVFGMNADDESWEIKNNTGDRVLWKSADYSGTDWKNDFEARHPEDSTNVTRLKAFAEWLVTTDQSAATGAELDESVTYETGETDTEGNPITVTHTHDTAEYRLAKFKAELADHAEVDGMVFFYLFTELFLMVDNRAKNAFPTFYDGGKWTILPYDFDTAIGTNNEGALVFSYELEDIDQTASGADVFNGQDSVLWVNLRQAFFNEIRTMYQNLRSDGKLSYADTEKRFEDHQSKWPEAIFNEDAYFKYLAPLVAPDEGENATAAYLSMLQGSKAEQRKWWLYNRYKYIDSKYNAGDALKDLITVRGYAKSDITVRPYADIYASIKYGSYLVQKRALRGSSYTLECPLDNVNDTEIYIYSASQLADVGDLSGLKVGYAEFSMATKLQSLKLGDSSADYSNANLTELYLGSNTLLKTLDVRNCPNLGLGEKQQSVDISGCTNIEEVYFDGTSIAGLTLPNGGMLRVLHLPETITNLTVRNQKALTEFVIPSYANVSTLRLENNSDVIDPLEILAELPANSRVRIIGFSIADTTASEVIALCDRLDTMRGLDENGNNVDKPQVSGTVYIASLTSAEMHKIQSRYPNITVIYNELIPCTIRFWNGDTLLQTVVTYTGAAEYTGETPVYPGETDWSRWAFIGWDPDPATATEDTDCYAQFEFCGSLARELVQRTIAGSYENDLVDAIGSYAFFKATANTSVSFPAVTTIGLNAFEGCSKLASADFPIVTTIGNYAFKNCSALASLDLPLATSIGQQVFYGNSALVTLILRADTVCTLSSTNAFSSSAVASGTGYIYVPSALVDSYKAATNWSTYADQIRAIEDYPEICGGE